MPTPSIIFLYPLNTQVVEVDGLQDEVSGEFLNNANLIADLLDQYGNLDPIFQGIEMGYIPGSNGNYQGTVPATFNATKGSGYTVRITGTQATTQAQWRIPAKVVDRRQV